ncbi:glucose-1-phosphate cytidylyltransferase [Roseburia sp. 831b]|uniref:glucose-1-phosphate cytidylyltransferase n=1 Tax=Roseburia sp. 831b TaxID=1261635 RepID=UPI0009521E72|nr:glucose-1-phosphate cytidylyltransferase [Roseburia sp. 831b]WVK72834.1 glucose-1-phosphate cytidylyltransferase [Roseburia sp. 831b]
MKVVILAGGRGSRLSEETYLKPKPMVEVGEAPILWHIMKIYSSYGYDEFVICCGYKGEMIKEYFMDYYMRASDITIDLSDNSYQVHEKVAEPWKVTLVNTGLNTNTAGRLMRVRKYLNEEPFMLTYGDGVSNVNIDELVKYHNSQKKIATITAARPAGRWGAIQIEDDTNLVQSFREKEAQDQAWVNSGFAVFEPEIFNYLTDESQQLEREPYDKLVRDNQMNAFKHYGFWHPMDTVNDKAVLEDYWHSGHAPWKIW